MTDTDKEEVLELSLSDLLDRAAVQGKFLPQNSTPEEVLRVLNENITLKGRVNDPELNLRSAMVGWVLEYYDQIRAQVRCSMDCISCPIVHVTLCHLHNRHRNLKPSGFIPEDNPWFLNS